tara:strand:- start:500 stop:943 length:444 start_codon:yes stop_codon:yes gene_type:complete
MNSREKKYRYIEWMTPEELHASTIKWMSELQFVRDEQLFLNDLVKSYTIQLIAPDIFEETKKVIDAIALAEKEVVALMKKVQAHENLLEVMVNDVDELKMEKAYLETHWELADLMDNYMGEYQKTKLQLFKVASTVMKKQKQKRLLL